jgi:hypothetical protein
MKIENDQDKRCAPSKSYIDNSCFSEESLKLIASNYNKKNSDKINLNLSKAELVSELNKKLNNKCKKQTCWLRLDIVKELNNEEINENTFRPIGPEKKDGWLSTMHIQEVLSQYEYNNDDFVFLGAVPYDFESLPLGISDINFAEFEKDGKIKIGMVINLDEHWKRGSHWVALYINLKEYSVYFFDSLGKPPKKLIKKFINKVIKYFYKKKYNSNLLINNVIDKLLNPKTPLANIKSKYNYINNLLEAKFNIKYNNITHQLNNSECGVYSINFIIDLLNGNEFDSVIHNIKRDNIMRENRKVFFRNTNF